MTTIDQMAADVFSKMPDPTTWQNYAVRQVFKACAASALTIERIECIICAIHGIPNNQVPGLRDALHALKNMGILRTRRAQGETLWEVNY